MDFPLAVDLGLEICGSLESATGREWLVTNGLGGYACGTIAGVLTRRYHGLLVAALNPPVGRTLLVSKFDEIVQYDGAAYSLGANRWHDGSVSPEGFRLIRDFSLHGTTPVWTFACSDAVIEKRVWMQEGANTTFVRYDVVRASAGPVDFAIKALVNYRDFHATTHAGDWHMDIATVDSGLRVLAYPGATPFFLLADSASAEPQQDWYRNFDLAEERNRGLDDSEDHLLAGIFRARRVAGQSVTLILSTDSAAALPAASALDTRAAIEEKHLEDWVAARPQASSQSPVWIRQLVLAASQFPVRRPLAQQPDASSLIAGYPWFSDWGRDTVIALPGVALETGRPELAKSILRAYARFVDRGMLPNYFPEGGQAAEYNTADATLWYFELVRQYGVATGDIELVRELFPLLAEIVDWHVKGTRYNIRVDQQDGLLHAGEAGVALTWMDAKVGGVPVTPRIGKPIEINALWYNALRTMVRFSVALNKSPNEYAQLAERSHIGFGRFWNPQTNCCFDVLDTPTGNDATLRPNQIFAVSLLESPLPADQRAAVVNFCAQRLLTPRGLRSLDPADPRYRPVYGGPPEARDAAYHQGTVWAWLLGPFVLAHLRVYRDAQAARSFLEPMADHLSAAGLGTISEIFDAEPPFTARGALAQAWSVGEILRAWRACQEAVPANRLYFTANPKKIAQPSF
jgi:predicted glycogen debranching enzyme